MSSNAPYLELLHGRLITRMSEHRLHGYLVPRFDVHQGEYIAPCDERLAFVTGFTGSAGLAIVLEERIVLFVDGRYTVQARRQCKGDLFELAHLTDSPPAVFLANLPSGSRIGFDPMLIPPEWYADFSNALSRRHGRLIAIDTNLVDEIWDDRPSPPRGRIIPMPMASSGENTASKVDRLKEHLNAINVDMVVETQPDNIAWLLNVRGDDVPYNPVPQSFLVCDREGRIDWFVDSAKLGNNSPLEEPDRVNIHEQSEFMDFIAGTLRPSLRISVDPSFSPVAVKLAAEQRGSKVRLAPSWMTNAKAVKTAAELRGLEECHIRDGVAWTEFSAWLGEQAIARKGTDNPISEIEAEDRILDFRRQQPGFRYESFRSISASGSNAAMCHYASDRSDPASLPEHGSYLLDSGGQYESGTTDATRSFAIGEQTDDLYRKAYTAVFQAFHALLTLRFPKGTQGHHIDAICRRPLWDLGLDYDHGTGHGVGHVLSVHEHPQRIGKIYNPVDLVPGMTMTIEPGHYQDGRYGIRIENTCVIVQDPDGFMRFKNLTWVPIDTRPLLTEVLSRKEKLWLKHYHLTVQERIAEYLSDRALGYLAHVVTETNALADG